MDRIREAGESVRENISNVRMPTPDDIRENAMGAVNRTMETVDNIKNSVSGSLNEFSSQASVNANQTFLDSNSIIAKFAFVIFAVILFIVLLYLGTKLVFYLYSPSLTPYIVRGVLAGNANLTISTNTKDDTNNITIQRSNNQPGGLEYSWSVWLSYNSITQANGTKMEHIFNKGDVPTTTNNNTATLNGPGMYFFLENNKPCLKIKIDKLITSSATNIDISGVPIKKWFHVALRVQNTVMDLYMNGSIAKRVILENPPYQNESDILIGQVGGFSGNLSDLRYYSYALNVFDINNILLFGPNLSPSSLSPDSNTSHISYLSSSWYSNNM